MNIMRELAILFGICLAGEGAAALLPVPFPASVISLVLLLVLLLTGVLKERWIQTVSRFLIVNMGLFFVPALVGTIEYVEVLNGLALPFLAVTLLTTPLVYLVTAGSVHLLMRITKRKGDGRHA